ncbi:MAG: MBL fold metallo-hydrolase, partial [Planctomycetes bacterium]|nr:MBL fold metallo-hydrolase [Planctomycetota bacterium]
MRLQWVGQACFFITAANGRSLLIDPFQRVIGLPRGQFPADVVVFSHNHLDHYDPGAVPPGAAIVAGPGFHDLNGFQCFGLRAYHDNREGLLSGEVTLYSFIVDGYRIVHLSDLGEDLDDYRLVQLGKPDILLFPAGEHTTITL